MHPRPPPPSYWCIPFFFQVGPCPLHEIAVPAFSRSPLGCADTFSFQYLRSTPRISLKCFSSFALFLSASLSLFSLLSFTSVLYPPNFSMDSTSSWSPPKSFHIFSTDVVPSYSSSTFFCCFLQYKGTEVGAGALGGGVSGYEQFTAELQRVRDQRRILGDSKKTHSSFPWELETKGYTYT